LSSQQQQYSNNKKGETVKLLSADSSCQVVM